MGGLWGTTVAPIVPTGIISHRLFINLLGEITGLSV